MAFVDELIPIGQFAGLTWLSPKALRIYQMQGLLHPAWIDPRSGYRYYDPSQIATAARISLLRRAGVPLAEIAAFLAAIWRGSNRWHRSIRRSPSIRSADCTAQFRRMPTE